MLRALYSSVQGLRAHQVKMDVIGNNIANVNTTAFKSSRVNFFDMYSQTLSGAAAPTASRGGLNSKQVGLGVGIASIDTLMSEGSLQLTGQETDMAISGDGFFVLKDGGKHVYTRAGNFGFDAEGYLVSRSTGQRVQGWVPNPTTGLFPSRDASTMTDVRLQGDVSLARATTRVAFDQALNASAPTGTTKTTAFVAYDSLGNEHAITLTFTKAAANRWTVAVSPVNGSTFTGPGGSAPYSAATELHFNADGSLVDNDANANTPLTMSLTNWAPGTGANPLNITIDFSEVVQPALATPTTESSIRALEGDGHPPGAIEKLTIDARGVITVAYSNGELREAGQVALANFRNPAGLVKEAGNNWGESTNSGMALIGQAGEAGRGAVTSNHLEMSNVDISEEFTNMIVTQRGFQANSRIITTSDELLQEVVNLKR